ncbi:MAG: adenylate/guanylate cyclase domain-containing protein [Actinomycetota bacterium]|nr:adenylate/guanylate cyclase domain-containing protein [Actinomycetota bacterium]
MRVEPEWAMVSVVFADIRGFTTFADRATAREAVDLLNEFFGVAIPVIERHGGFVHQLLGDGLLALFGAPFPVPDHPDRALAAGAEMLDAVDAQLGERCRIGIGINTGLVLVGTIGGGDHRRLAVVGDPVNVAARVQGATRDVGAQLLVTEATRCLLDAGGPGLEPLGGVSLKGKSHPVTVHRLEARSALKTPSPRTDAA